MAQRYRLLFQGEVLDGQHKAVVKKRLAGVLKMERDRIDALFAGEPVVIKRDVDRPTAARYQGAFKEAGARLRVVEIPGSKAEAAEAPATPAAAGELSVAEPGTPLTDAVRTPAPAGPDTSHLSVAELGADLVDLEEAAPVEVVFDPSWELAEVGSDMGQIPTAVPELEVSADFDLDAPGVTMDQRKRPSPPPPPDTSHLSVDEDA